MCVATTDLVWCELEKLRMSAPIEAPALQYISDSDGHPVGVIVPSDLWQEMQQEIRSERETAYLLSSETMKKRLLEEEERTGGLSLEDVRAQFGI